MALHFSVFKKTFFHSFPIQSPILQNKKFSLIISRYLFTPNITGLLKCTTLRFASRTDWAMNKMPHHPMIRTSKRKIDLLSKALNLPLCNSTRDCEYVVRTCKRERDLLRVKRVEAKLSTSLFACCWYSTRDCE